MGPQLHVAESRRGAVRGWLNRCLASLSLAPRARELERARKAADAELMRAAAPPPRLAWRSAELTAGARRLKLGDELRRLVDAADGRYMPSSASPIDRGKVRAETETLLTLAARLGDLRRPVSPRSVLMLERLLRDGDGPLYRGEGREALAGSLAEVMQALEAS